MTLTFATDDRGDPFADVPDSLASTSVGDEVLVESIDYNLVRTLCADRGIQVGDRLGVRYCEGEAVIVRNVKARQVRIPAPYALFVRVSHIPAEFTKARGNGQPDRREGSAD